MGQDTVYAGQVRAYEEVAGALAEILSGPEFQSAQPGLLHRMMAAVLDALGELLRSIVLRTSAGPGEVLAWALGAAATVVLVLALGRAAGRLVVRRRLGGRRVTAPDRAGVRTAAGWLRAAAERAERGDYRAAATALYQAVLLALDGAGVVAFHPSKTPGEYAAEAGAKAPGEDAERFLADFQRAAFGLQAPAAGAYRRLELLARGLAGVAPSSNAAERAAAR